MKNLQRLCAALVLTSAITIPAIAGEMSTGIAGQMQTGFAGEIGTTVASTDPATGVMLSLLQSVLSHF
jgi:hypothetical protein